MAGKAEDPNPFIAFSLLLGRGFEAFEPAFEIEETFSAKAMELMPLTDSHCIGELMGIGMQANLNQGESLKAFPIGKGPGVMAAAEKMEVPLTGWSGEPVYIGQGTADPLVPFSDVLTYSTALCEQGVAVTLDVYEEQLTAVHSIKALRPSANGSRIGLQTNQPTTIVTGSMSLESRFAIAILGFLAAVSNLMLSKQLVYQSSRQ